MSRAIVMAVRCERCGAEFELPELSEGLKSELGKLARSDTILEVIRRLQEQAGLEPARAKGIALHITRIKGVCHRCYYPLSLSVQLECSECHALNLDW